MKVSLPITEGHECHCAVSAQGHGCAQLEDEVDPEAQPAERHGNWQGRQFEALTCEGEIRCLCHADDVDIPLSLC